MDNYSLDSLLDGAVAELYTRAMQEVAVNVLDPNTKATAKRKVIITLEIAPNEMRDIADMNVSIKTSLAPHANVSGRLLFDRDKSGKAVCGEYGTNSRQLAITVAEDGETGVDTKEEFKGLKLVK